jgi:hypothetical protein
MRVAIVVVVVVVHVGRRQLHGRRRRKQLLLLAGGRHFAQGTAAGEGGGVLVGEVLHVLEQRGVGEFEIWEGIDEFRRLVAFLISINSGNLWHFNFLKLFYRIKLAIGGIFLNIIKIYLTHGVLNPLENVHIRGNVGLPANKLKNN